MTEESSSTPVAPQPPAGKRAENRRMRTEALQRAALALFLQYGVEAVTIDQIVDGARTAKGSFYRYFRDKTDLVATLVEPMRLDVRAAFATCAEGLREASRAGNVAKPYESLAQDLIRVVVQYADVVRLYLHESRGPKNGARAPIVELAEEVLDGATELSNVAHALGLVRGLVGRLSAIVVVGASELIVARLFAGDDVGPILEMPGELVSLVLDGVRARQPSAQLAPPTKEREPEREPEKAAARKGASRGAKGPASKRAAARGTTKVAKSKGSKASAPTSKRRR
ncbi:MAG: TetR/AcrR family transcriptional regulator [Polyangiaceae bacterium]